MDTRLPPRPAAANSADPRSDGVRAERERCRAITQGPAARGREIATKIIAFETDLSAEVGVKILASLPLDGAPDTPDAGAVSWDAVAASVSTGGKR